MKYILCRPHGGLNDSLCQIEKSWTYAERFDRFLIIDLSRSRVFYDFSLFFELAYENLNIHFALQKTMLDKLNRLSCYPSEVQGIIDLYETEYSFEFHNFCDKKSKIQISFDYERDYNEQLLVSEQCGGGDNAISMLERVTLQKGVRAIIEKALISMPMNYTAVHIRNTDLKTDYKNLLNKIKVKIKSEYLLVCSDDINVIIYSEVNLSNVKIITTKDLVVDIFPTELTGLVDEVVWKSSINALFDLIALANADTLFYGAVAGGGVSGFSKLAGHLCLKKNILFNLIGIDQVCAMGKVQVIGLPRVFQVRKIMGKIFDKLFRKL